MYATRVAARTDLDGSVDTSLPNYADRIRCHGVGEATVCRDSKGQRVMVEIDAPVEMSAERAVALPE